MSGFNPNMKVHGECFKESKFPTNMFIGVSWITNNIGAMQQMSMMFLSSLTLFRNRRSGTRPKKLIVNNVLRLVVEWRPPW